MQSARFFRGLALLLLAIAPCTLWATTPVGVSAASEQAAPTATPDTGQVAGFGQRVAMATLARLSGGSDLHQKMTLTGTVSDTHADHVVTGANVISSGSFSGAAGLPMVIQNTGNGVLIQNATIVSVKFQP